ncbi:MAG: hypothetical protein Kow00127_23340 [Bacteroidales bacterium]
MVLLVIFLTGKYILEIQIANLIEEKIQLPDSSVYQLGFDKLRIKLLDGDIAVKGFSMARKQPEGETGTSRPGEIYYRLKVPGIDLTGVSLLKILTENKIVLDSIKIHNPEVSAFYVTGNKSDEGESDTLVPGKDEEIISSFALEKFSIEGGSFKLYSENPGGPDQRVQILEINHIDAYVGHILLSFESGLGNIPFLLDKSEFHFKNIQYDSLKDNQLKVANSDFTLSDTSLVLRDLTLKPKWNEDELYRHIPYQTDIFDVSIDSLKIKQVHLQTLINTGNLIIDSIEIFHPQAGVSRNKYLAKKNKGEVYLPATALARLPLNLTISSCRVINGRIEYRELAPPSENPGFIQFGNLFLSIYNISYDRQVLQENPWMEAGFKAKLMDVSGLNARIRLLLTSPEDYFEISGTLGSFPAKALNPALVNLAGASVKSGKIEKTEFQFSGNKFRSLGELQLDYTDLQLEALRTKENVKSGFFKWILKGLTRKQNLPEAAGYRIGAIYFNRPSDKGFPGYLWKSLQTGIISIVAPIADQSSRNLKKENNLEKKRQKKMK